jgi:RimJ/RimL family protein N-acetyltransferase
MRSLAALLPARSERTVVRLLRERDVTRFHAYRSDETLAQFQGWTPMSSQEALAFLQVSSTVRDVAPGGWIQLGIAVHDTDELIGDLGLFVEADFSDAEIGFTLCPEHQGRGHATRAVQISVGLLFATTEVASIRAVTDVRNRASIGVLRRAGFQLVREQRAVFKGEPCTELVYTRRRDTA